MRDRRFWQSGFRLLPAIALLVGCLGSEEPVSSDKRSINGGQNTLVGELEAVGTIPGCTATLIDPHTVLTAGHCVCNSPAGVPWGNNSCTKRTTFTMHNVFPQDNPATPQNESLVRRDVQLQGTVYPHPEFEKTGWLTFDLAIIRLDEAAWTQAPQVQPISVAPRRQNPKTGQSLTLVGYGSTGKDCSLPGGGIKRKVTLDVDGVGSPGPVLLAEAGKHNCPGDSGGPIINAQGHLSGVASWGNFDSRSFYWPVAGSHSWVETMMGRGEVWVAKSQGAKFIGTYRAARDFCTGTQTCLTGDFNGDGQDDLVGFDRFHVQNRGYAQVWVALNNNGTFEPRKLWHSQFSFPGETPAVGDFNGDGKDDIVTFLQNDEAGQGQRKAWVFVALSDGTNFANTGVWQTNFSYGGEVPRVGDFNGDGKDDIVTFLQDDEAGQGQRKAWVYVALSNGASFVNARPWQKNFSYGGEIPRVGDFNGDGKDDIVTFLQNDEAGQGQQRNWVYVALSNGTQFLSAGVWHQHFCRAGEIPDVGDFDGDGKADVVTFLQGDQAGRGKKYGWVYSALSTGWTFSTAQLAHKFFSLPGELPALGQIDGQGGQDIVTFTR